MQHNTSLCTIMKNCEDVIDTFFKWAIDNFTEINVVVDPNNGDRTIWKCATWADLHPDTINLIEHEFDDFSRQKQRAYNMCTKPYAILIDSDEIIEELPNDAIENFMWRTNADIGVLSRYNFQEDDKHCFGYPDNQYRVIKMSSGVEMNGNVVDEMLNINNKLICLLPWHIIHYGHIRPVNALKLKGRDRLKFANCDACDGEMLKKHGEDWFIERNKMWNNRKIQVPIYITDYSRKYRKL